MLSRFHELVLRAVRQLGPDCRANEIQAELTRIVGKEQSFGAIFTTLDRLDAKRFVRWVKGEPENRRGGRAPRLYTITADGVSALNEATRINIASQATVGEGVVVPGVAGGRA